MEWLLALYGAPFAVVFDAGRPSAGADPLQGSPFEIVAEALGFAHNKFSGSSPESAFDTVHQALLQGHPVIVRHGSPPRWIIVTGYDLREQQVHFMPPGRERYAVADREQFLAAWSSGSSRGSGVAGAEPFYQFSLAARLQQPSDDALLRAAVERAAEIMQRNTLSGAPAGAAAWQAAGAWLERCVAPEDPSIRETAAAWVDDSLRLWVEMARMVTPVLEKAEQAVPKLQGASARHAELVQEAELIARKVEEATAAQQEAPTKWQAAAAQANYVAALHQRLAEQFVAAANGG